MQLTSPRNFVPGPTRDEELKMRKDGLDVLADIHRYASTGFSSIAPEDLPLLKWYGLYPQRPRESGYFMLRLRLPGGQITSRQLDAVGGIAADFGRDLCDVTTRQTFQFHWLTIDQIPDLFQRLQSVGLSSVGACGDTGRNVVGCPAAGILADEMIDATPELMAVDSHLFNNKEFSNLPRKFKVSVCGCRIHCAQPDINCMSFFGLERHRGGHLKTGYGVKIGGGLSSSPHLAQTMPVFLRPADVLPMAHFTTIVFRDFGYRSARNRARFKFLVADWGAEKVLEKVEELSGLRFERHHDFRFPDDPETDHIGIHEQKHRGLYFVGLSFAGGRASGSQLRLVAELSRRHAAPGLDIIRATNKQNLILLNIPEATLPALKRDLDDGGFHYRPGNFRRGCVSCTGIEYCNLAIAETKNRMISLVGELEKSCAQFSDKIRIHFSGCPSSCGQHQIADIGFRGGRTKVDGISVDAFDMFIGGKLGQDARFASLVKSKVLSTDVLPTIDRLLRHYTEHRYDGESFADFAARTPREIIQKALEVNS